MIIYVLIATLAVSIVGMITLLTIKRYELTTGRIFLASSRPAIGEFFYRKMQWVEYVLPGLLRVGVRRMYLLVRRVVHVWAARLVVRVEQWLEKALHRVRHTAPTLTSGGRSSAFLREVTEHKKQVKRRAPKKIVIED